jgi:predicted kinase
MNHFIVFDSNLSSYYMHDDSYYHSVLNKGYQVYVIALDIPEAEIRRRVTGRDRADKAEVLTQLTDQLIAQHKAMDKLHPNFTVTADADTAALLNNLRTFVAEAST